MRKYGAKWSISLTPNRGAIITQGVSRYVEIMRIAALHIAHDVGDGVRRSGFKNPMAVVMKEAPAVNLHAVKRGVLAHVAERLLKVLGVAVDPLALIAALGDGVKLLGTEVTRKSHADH